MFDKRNKVGREKRKKGMGSGEYMYYWKKCEKVRKVKGHN